jgi:ribosome biogenesis GTPase
MGERLRGEVIGAYGRQYQVRLEQGGELPCLTRGKKSEVVCGDQVEVMRTGDDQGVIEKILPRSTLLYRSDEWREKLIAANVSQIIVVLAGEPGFSDELLARCLVAAHAQDIRAVIVLNKCDLTESTAAARQRLQPYVAAGYQVIELSARQGAEALLPVLQGHRSVLVGQSGMGKSTLINALVPDAGAATREISTVLDSGKHTTTHARLYRLDAQTTLIDCPGVQAFGLHHLSQAEIEAGFVEFAPYRGQCRFYNCRHQNEPGCALDLAAKDGKLDARRLELFRMIGAQQK